jgi:hypothetical protein
MSNTIDDFVNVLLEEKDLTGLDPDVINQIKKDLYARVENKINASILAKIPPQKMESFEELLSSNSSSDEIQKFCTENIRDLESVVASALLEFRSSYLNN